MDTTEAPLVDELRLDLFVGVAYACAYCAVMLLLLGRHTEALFAWAMDPLTAAAIGSAYAGSLVMCLAAVRSRSWPTAATIVPSLVVVITGTLAASVLDRSRLRLDGGPVVAYTASYTWLAVHLVLAGLLVRGLLRQRRTGSRAPRGKPAMPWAMRGPLLLVATACLGPGLALFLLPGHAGWWPWPLDPLDARLIGVWAISLGAGFLAAERAADLWAARPGLCAVTVTALLELVTLARFRSELTGAGSLVYAVVLTAMAFCGAVGLAFGGSWRRPDPGPPPNVPATPAAAQPRR